MSLTLDAALNYCQLSQSVNQLPIRVRLVGLEWSSTLEISSLYGPTLSLYQTLNVPLDSAELRSLRLAHIEGRAEELVVYSGSQHTCSLVTQGGHLQVQSQGHRDWDERETGLFLDEAQGLTTINYLIDPYSSSETLSVADIAGRHRVPPELIERLLDTRELVVTIDLSGIDTAYPTGTLSVHHPFSGLGIEQPINVFTRRDEWVSLRYDLLDDEMSSGEIDIYSNGIQTTRVVVERHELRLITSHPDGRELTLRTDRQGGLRIVDRFVSILPDD